MSSDESYIETRTTVLRKKPLKKEPISPTAKQTKKMVDQALVVSKTRSGSSLNGIKNYIKDTYNVDVEKYNDSIKTYLKTSVELGTIVQVKGVGVTASYKLAPEQEKSGKKKKPTKKPEETSKTEEPKTKPVNKVESNDNNSAKMAKKNEILKKKVDKKGSDVEKKSSGEKVKAVETKMVQVMQTRANKRAARKSIGSIIKPPKMKPKATKNEA